MPNPLGAAAGLACVLPGAAGPFGLDGSFGAAAGFVGAAALWTQPSPWETGRTARSAALFFGVLQVAALLSAAWAGGVLGHTGMALDWPALLQPALFGVLAAYSVRHYDGHVRATLDGALAAAVYVSWAYRGPEDFGAFSAPAACWMLLFSRTRLRLLHGGAAVLATALCGDNASWAAASLAACAAAGWALHERLRGGRTSRRRGSLAFAAAATLWAAALSAPLPALARRPAVTAAAEHAIARSPWLGWGPAAAERLPSKASQWTYWRLRGGWLCAALWGLGLAWTAAALLSGARGRARVGAAAMAAGMALVLGGSPALESGRVLLVWSLLAVGVARSGGHG